MTIHNCIDALMARFGYVRAPKKTASKSAQLKIEIDTGQVHAALEPVQQLTVAATEAEAALAKLWNIQAAMQYRHPYTGAGGVSGADGTTEKSVLEDEMAWSGRMSSSANALTPDGLVMNELLAIRAELKALREHSGARITTITDSERFAHMPPPAGAKHGRWEVATGSAIPVWVEHVPMEYDPAAGAVKPSDPVATEVV